MSMSYLKRAASTRQSCGMEKSDASMQQQFYFERTFAFLM
jgi:hypothetical protein